MKRFAWLIVFVLALLGAVPAAQTPVPASPGRWATDTAGFLSQGTLQAVDRQLEEFERTTGNQVLVWIGNTTGGVPLEDWTIKAFEQWKVGRQGLDNGLILFIFATDRRARIEVGYGLEAKVPDIIASRILNDVVIPRIKTGDRDGAVLQGVNALTAAIAGTDAATGAKTDVATGAGTDAGTGAPAPGLQVGPGDDGIARERPRMSPVEMLVLGVLGLAFLVLLITNPQLALYLLINILASGRSGSGGGSSGGGGFSGGGGRGGGGGASGSW
jgi:uncharacterized protein